MCFFTKLPSDLHFKSGVLPVISERMLNHPTHRDVVWKNYQSSAFGLGLVVFANSVSRILALSSHSVRCPLSVIKRDIRIRTDYCRLVPNVMTYSSFFSFAVSVSLPKIFNIFWYSLLAPFSFWTIDQSLMMAMPACKYGSFVVDNRHGFPRDTQPPSLSQFDSLLL